MRAISLAAARVDAGLTQLFVANRLGVSKNTVVNYEKYRTIVDMETAKVLAALYGRTVDEIRWS